MQAQQSSLNYFSPPVFYPFQAYGKFFDVSKTYCVTVAEATFGMSWLPKLFSKLVKLLIRPDLYDIWVNQRTWINNMHKCISNREWLMHEGSGYFSPFFSYHPEDASATSSARVPVYVIPLWQQQGMRQNPLTDLSRFLCSERGVVWPGVSFSRSHLSAKSGRTFMRQNCCFGWQEQYLLNQWKLLCVVLESLVCAISLSLTLPFLMLQDSPLVHMVHVFQLLYIQQDGLLNTSN